MKKAWQIVSEKDLSLLEISWRSLEQRARGVSIYQTFDWCQAWVDAASAANAPETVRVLTITLGARVVLLWPLAIRRLAGARILHTLGQPSSQYSNVLVCPERNTTELLHLAWTTLGSWNDIDAIELRRVRQDTPLASLPEIRPYRVRDADAAAPYLDYTNLPPSGVAGQRTSRTRNALRRHERLLAEHGPVSFKLIGDAPDQIAAFAEAVQLKTEWTKKRSSASAGSAHPASRGCLERLAMDGHLCGARLRIGEETAAVEIGIKRHGIYWSLLQSYDLRFSRHAPGRLLFWKFLEACPKLGIDRFDFLAPADKHKREWSNGEVPINDYLVPISVRGRMVTVYLARVKPALRSLYRRLPSGTRLVAARFMNYFS